jgi:hypothetical protein
MIRILLIRCFCVIIIIIEKLGSVGFEKFFSWWMAEGDDEGEEQKGKITINLRENLMTKVLQTESGM